MSCEKCSHCGGSGREPVVPIGERECVRCGLSKPASEFIRPEGFSYNKWCRDCLNGISLKKRIPVGPIRELVELWLRQNPDETWSTLDALRGAKTPSPTPVKRLVGVKPYWCKGELRFTETMLYSTALSLCEAMGLDPVECGL